MREDSLVSARKIRQPIESNDDIANAFDNITYSKGEAVIRMFESWAGERAFQQGVQRYIKQYSWRTATAGDFLDSVASAANPALTKAFSTFLDQPGVPLLSVKLNCDTPGSAILHLSQKRALPLGSPGGGAGLAHSGLRALWRRDGAHPRLHAATQASMDWKLPEAKSCPAWVQANADGAGYYRARYEGDLLGKLLADGGRRLPPAERVAALGDVAALTTMGEVKAGDALALVPNSPRTRCGRW